MDIQLIREWFHPPLASLCSLCIAYVCLLPLVHGVVGSLLLHVVAVGSCLMLSVARRSTSLSTQRWSCIATPCKQASVRGVYTMRVRMMGLLFVVGGWGLW
jgi:hypothetical protein